MSLVGGWNDWWLDGFKELLTPDKALRSKLNFESLTIDIKFETVEIKNDFKKMSSPPTIQ